MQTEINVHQARLETAVRRHNQPQVMRGHHIQPVLDAQGIQWTEIVDAGGRLWTDRIPMTMTGFDAAKQYVIHYQLGWNDGYDAGMKAARAEIRAALGIDDQPIPF